jgi:adenine-specific DNA-methyltransferase
LVGGSVFAYHHTTAKDEIFDLFGDRDLFATPKPEKLLAELIRLSTKPSDIVLDYHLGSGTTAAVAHKMGRQYIGIEQMDYIENIAVERLKKVIGGEMSGVSKNQNWGGGGEFIYFELAKHNESAKDIINACNSLDELNTVFAIMCDKYFLDYHLRVKEFREQIIYEEEFKNLALDKQKHMFIAMLDQNQLYVNYTEMADSKYNLSQKDQHLTELFYNQE